MYIFIALPNYLPTPAKFHILLYTVEWVILSIILLFVNNN